MNDSKYVFPVFVAFSIVIHMSFLFASGKIWINSGSAIEEEIKTAFRMREITFMREIRSKKPIYSVKKIQFPDLRKEVLQKAQDLIFDDSSYNKAFVDSSGDVMRDPGLKKDLNYFEAVSDSFKILHAVDDSAKEQILISNKRSFIPADILSGFDIKGTLAGIERGFSTKLENEERNLRQSKKKLSLEGKENMLTMHRPQRKKIGLDKEKIDFSGMEKSILAKETDADDVSVTDNLDNTVDLQIKHAYIAEDSEGFFRMQLNIKDMYTGLQAFPKDVVFVLDISRSMEDEQVRKIIDAITDIVINQLETNDRFNIVLFSQNNKVFKDTLVKRGFSDRSGELSDFFKNVVTRGQTDVYGSLSSIMTPQFCNMHHMSIHFQDAYL